MLRSAGYEHVAFARYDTDICIGRTLDEAVEFAVAVGPAGEIIQLAGEGGELLRALISGPTAFGPVQAPDSSPRGFLRPSNPGRGVKHCGRPIIRARPDNA